MDVGRARNGVDAGLPRLPHSLAVLHEDLRNPSHDVLGLIIGPDGRARCVVVGAEARYQRADGENSHDNR